MPYQLKKGVESFEIMGGPDEGKQFSRGKVYDAVPDGYADKFDAIDAPEAPSRLIKKKAEPVEKTIAWDVAETDNKETK